MLENARDHGDGELIRVVIGHFDPLTALGLTAAFDKDARIYVLACDLREKALEDAVKREAPSVIVVGMGVASSLLARLRAQRLAPAVLVLAGEIPELSRTMLTDAGVMCVSHEASIAHLLAAVHRAATHRKTALARPSSDLQQDPVTRLHLLTGREMDVLRLLSRGAPYDEVAEALGMSVSTAKGHFAEIKLKLGVASKRDLIGIAT